MRIAVLGTGAVGRTLAVALRDRGDEVVLGTREPATTARTDGAGLPDGVSLASFSDAASGAELSVLAVGGSHALEAVRGAGAAALAGKVLIDVTNPLDFSGGLPPTLSVCNTSSLGEQVQAAAPDALVVKALNTVAASVMVDPGAVAAGAHDLLVCGNDDGAKAQVGDLLCKRFGWRTVIDLGDITASRGMEMYLPLWLRLSSALGTVALNLQVKS